MFLRGRVERFFFALVFFFEGSQIASYKLFRDGVYIYNTVNSRGTRQGRERERGCVLERKSSVDISNHVFFVAAEYSYEVKCSKQILLYSINYPKE